MATAEDRVGMLEMRVKTLETWAGPGQTEALAEGQRAIRADLASLRSDVGKLRTDVGKLTVDMAKVKGILQEILRRLPPPAG
jgi:hypothetical protein